MFNPDKYRSVTWLKGGRVYPQLDCFGIVNEIRRDLNLPVWPDFAGVTKDDGGLDREARRMMLTLERCEPCEGAGVACYSRVDCHPRRDRGQYRWSVACGGMQPGYERHLSAVAAV
ncbi:nitrite transporter [Klebsiella pneumoniae]|nr:nitrite transporter [Klebsiella pneumoniae]